MVPLRLEIGARDGEESSMKRNWFWMSTNEDGAHLEDILDTGFQVIETGEIVVPTFFDL